MRSTYLAAALVGLTAVTEPATAKPVIKPPSLRPPAAAHGHKPPAPHPPAHKPPAAFVGPAAGHGHHVTPAAHSNPLTAHAGPAVRTLPPNNLLTGGGLKGTNIPHSARQGSQLSLKGATERGLLQQVGNSVQDGAGQLQKGIDHGTKVVGDAAGKVVTNAGAVASSARGSAQQVIKTAAHEGEQLGTHAAGVLSPSGGSSFGGKATTAIKVSAASVPATIPGGKTPALSQMVPNDPLARLPLPQSIPTSDRGVAKNNPFSPSNVSKAGEPINFAPALHWAATYKPFPNATLGGSEGRVPFDYGVGPYQGTVMVPTKGRIGYGGHGAYWEIGMRNQTVSDIMIDIAFMVATGSPDGAEEVSFLGSIFGPGVGVAEYVADQIAEEAENAAAKWAFKKRFGSSP
jgi:hypothetical protein